MIYTGTYRLYRTANRGDSWQAISGDLTGGEQSRGRLIAIAVAPSDPGTIYTGSSDGLVAVTRNQGSSWSDVTGSSMPNRYVSDIAVSPQSATKAYVTFNGFSTHTPAKPGKIFRTSNAGGSWQDITNNLPDVPVLSIALDPENANHLYVGTDIGVFRSTNDGTSWSFFSQGLATIPITDLFLNSNTRQLWAASYGRGVYGLNLGGSAPTPTSTPSAQSLRMYLPMNLKSVRLAPTPTPPSTGPAPGDWQGDKTTFSVTADQRDAWNVRVNIPVPGCEIWLQYPIAPIQGNRFDYVVDLREQGKWTNSGRFSNSTTAQGTVQVDNMYFGMSCGNWSGTVNWTATWQGGSGTDPTPTPTATRRPPTATPSSRSGIYGQVSYQDQGVGGVNLILRRCPSNDSCDFQTSKVTTTTTDANGYYSFTGAPSLPGNNIYFVYFYNHSDGGNTPNDHYLWRWYGTDITSYSSGANVSGGDFDIADIELTGPATEQTSLPATFTWNKRDMTGERYAWELFDLSSGASKCFSDPSTNASFQLSSNTFVNDCGGNYGTTYGWFA